MQTYTNISKFFNDEFANLSPLKLYSFSSLMVMLYLPTEEELQKEIKDQRDALENKK